MSSSASRPRPRILIAGATGQQGGAVIRAFQSHVVAYEYELLALTRSATSKKALQLAQLPHVSIVEGNLDQIEEVFENVGGVGSIWGVFLAQLPIPAKNTEEPPETRQGKAVIDASIKYGVQHFVYSSVDRHGVESDKNPTPIPHFISKHMIEDHLRLQTQHGTMNYTILRPVAFMDNLTPTFFGRAFAAMWGSMQDVRLQLVAVKDIGSFAVEAFASPETDEYKNRAISLAGDELSQAEANEVFWRTLGRPMPRTYGFVSSLIQNLVPEVGLMFKWFIDVGYDADIHKCRKLKGGMLDLATWLKEESRFQR